jgi:hypothetical protein
MILPGKEQMVFIEVFPPLRFTYRSQDIQEICNINSSFLLIIIIIIIIYNNISRNCKSTFLIRWVQSES